MELREIPRIAANEFRPSRWGGEPRVVVGNVKSWKALQLWDPDYLRSAIGEQYIPIRETDGPPRNIYQNLAQGGKVAFTQYLDWVLDTANAADIRNIEKKYSDVSDITRAICKSGFEASYYLNIELEELSKKLLQDIEIPNWYKGRPSVVNFWCGILGTSSGLHSDIAPNCNVQVRGHKHFILFSPRQAKFLYQGLGITHCLFDPNLPDFDRFPLGRKASGWQCRLKPGDSLYIPVGWFHQVTVTSKWALNVNFFWPRPFPQGVLTPSLWRLFMRKGWARWHIFLASSMNKGIK
ncbi:cupin-like domain-containing protein [Nitrosospira sp. Is2]|uniref:cupin-like domain-containing protein n=1 Tax=Nitrosospira sp. Is2 TaxID=3080532 RepID=UPI0029548863|nr:cupin-like domain-containing protein [Nitrosospira sp. Is2]WON74460.1 cupin-like domain-containing protein [Nitrosospira sp. Is2]